MKAPWDNLAVEYIFHEHVLIADVDCTAEGEKLCKRHGVTGYPTLMTFRGSMDKGELYEGGRSYRQLQAHAASLLPRDPMPLAYKVGIGVATVLVIWIGGQVARIW